MITVYTGAPGSGKSLHMVKDISKTIQYGKKVICNLDIMLPGKLAQKSDNLFCMENDSITPEFLRDFAARNHEPRRESQTLVVIDECQLKFSDTFMTKASARPWMEFFSQHRKLGFDFLLVTPSSRTGITRPIRENLEIETTHFKLCNYPTKSIFLSLIFLLIAVLPINIFMSVSQWKGLTDKQYLVRHMFMYSPKYAGMYDTYKIYEVALKQQTGQKGEPHPEDQDGGGETGGAGGALPRTDCPDAVVILPMDYAAEAQPKHSVLHRIWTYLNRPIHIRFRGDVSQNHDRRRDPPEVIEIQKCISILIAREICSGDN